MKKLITHLSILLGLLFPAFASAQSQTVPAGWSMLGNDAGAAIDVEAIFGNATTPTGISGSVTTVWSWSNALSRWNFYTPSMTPQEMSSYADSKGYGVLSSIAKGEGFWVNAKNQFVFGLTATVTPTPTPTPTPTGTLAGTAAVGSPIVGAEVKISCSSGSPLTTVTSSTGTWQITTSGQMLPCGLQVNGGTINGAPNATPYHSIAISFGNVNITPLTDLVVAKLAGTEPRTWFTAAKFDAITADNITTALSTVSTTLGLASTLGTMSPMTSAFVAKTGDKIDNVLQALAKALPSLSKTYSELLTAAATNNLVNFSGFGTAFAAAYNSVAGGSSTGSGTGTATSCTTGQLTMAYAGIAGVFTDGQNLCITATTTSLAFSGKTLSNPVRNTAVSAPYSAYKFSDTDGSVYELIFKDTALYEINVLMGTTFQGQLTPVSAPVGNRTLTLEFTASGILAPAVVVTNVPQPQSEAEFCGAVKTDPNLTSITSTTGGTTTINSCSYSGNVGNISMAVAITTPISMTIPYTVKYAYGP
ncbi:MAG: hypothetical protein K9K38_23010 [Rhodoferax sp.]|nr:hypothetical protein [Rhodoferax sp.]